MLWSFEVKTVAALTTAVIQGRLGVSEFSDMQDQVQREFLLQRGLGLILDIRAVTLDISTLDLFEIAHSASDKFGRETPLAVIIAPTTMSTTDARFFENIICNRGGLASFFTDLAAAEEWQKGCLKADHKG